MRDRSEVLDKPFPNVVVVFGDLLEDSSVKSSTRVKYKRSLVVVVAGRSTRW